MTLGSYLGRRKGEMLLVLISAWTVTCVALNGFNLDSFVETYGYATRLVVALVLDAISVFALYLAAFNRDRRALGIIGYLVLTAVLAFVGMATSSGQFAFQDAEGNYLYFSLVVSITCAACFLLSRSNGGSLAWFVASAFVCSLIQAFYRSNELVLSLVALLSSCALVIYRNYRRGAEGAQLARKGSSHYAFGASLVPAAIALALAAGIWFVVVAPLNPGTLDVKLFTDYRQLPIEEVVGTSQQNSQLNYDYTSQITVSGDRYTTDDLQEDSTSDTTVDAASALQQQAAQELAGQGSGGSGGGGSKQTLDDSSLEQQYQAISYTADFPWMAVWIGIVLFIIALAAAYFLIRRKMRMNRLRRYLGLEPDEQIIEIYRFLLERMRRLGFQQPEGMTLREFADSSLRQMDMITQETKVSFKQLTETYIAVVYGEYVPTEEDVVPFAAFYLRFWKAARLQVGNLKYFFLSFRL